MNGGVRTGSCARPSSIGSKDPHALKIPARRAEYLLTENVASPFQAEPAQSEFFVHFLRQRFFSDKGLSFAESATVAMIPSALSRSDSFARCMLGVLVSAGAAI